MTLLQLKETLKNNPGKKISFVLPDGTVIPKHFHVTEVGHVTKVFIDCGGTQRSLSSCVLQTWSATDEDHSLNSDKFLSILNLARQILPPEDLPVEIEFEAPYISQFPILTLKIENDALIFQLEPKHTDCLAKEKCGIESDAPKTSCCSSSGGCC